MNIHLNDGSGIVEITAPTIILGTGGYSNVPNVPAFKRQVSLLVKVSLAINSLNNHTNPLLYSVQVQSVLNSVTYLHPLVQR